jgi:hypothetical protein
LVCRRDPADPSRRRESGLTVDDAVCVRKPIGAWRNEEERDLALEPSLAEVFEDDAAI